MVPLMISTQRGLRGCKHLIKPWLRKFFWGLTPTMCSVFSSFLASKVSILWASHLDSPPWPKPFSVWPPLDICGRLKKEDSQMDLESPVQAAYLRRTGLRSADNLDKGYPFSLCSTEDGFITPNQSALSAASPIFFYFRLSSVTVI